MLKKIKFVKSALNNFFLGEIWQHCREDNRCQSISMVTHKNKYISIKLVTRLFPQWLHGMKEYQGQIKKILFIFENNVKNVEIKVVISCQTTVTAAVPSTKRLV